MKLVMTLLVRDEQDIVGSNISYHLEQGVDQVIATDHGSTDATTDILREYERQGYLRYIHEASEQYRQSEWVTRMARLAVTDHGADWVINNDADEFWWPKEGDLKSSLSRIPPQAGTVRVVRSNFRPRPGVTEWSAEAMTVRETRSLNVMDRPLPPKVCHRGVSDVKTGPGNHTVAGPGLDDRHEGSPILVFHFPMRTYEQFERRIVDGAEAYLRTPNIAPNVGRGRRTLYGAYRAGLLRNHWDRYVMTESDVASGVASGSLIIDTRLARYFARHPL